MAILIKARDLASGSIKRVKGEIGGLGRAAHKTGGQLGTLGKGVGVLAGGAALFVGAAVKSGLDSLVVLEAANATTQAIIKSTGGVAKVSAVEVRTWANEIEKATGAAVDDKAIQAAENVLLRGGAVTHDMFKRVAADSVDLGAAMKTGPEKGAKTLAKALADPAKAAGALRKAGIFLSKTDQARIKDLMKHNKLAEAQTLILGKVEAATKGAALASAGPLAKSQHMLADAWEDAKMALATGFLPVLTKVGDKLSAALADPKTMNDIKNLGQGLADGFDKVLNVAGQVPWGSIKDAMMAGKEFAAKAFDLFTGLPPWVQTAVITGWGLNKLTGGALGDVVGALASGLIKGVLGMTAGLVNVKAGAVTVTGTGVGGGPGTPVGVPGSKTSGIGTLMEGLSKVLLVGFVAEAAQQIHELVKAPPDIPASQLSWPWGPKNTPTILPDIFGGNGLLGGTGTGKPKTPESKPTRPGPFARDPKDHTGPQPIQSVKIVGGHAPGAGVNTGPLLTGIGTQLSDLRKVQQIALSRGDTKTAARVAGQIQKLESNIGSRLNGVKSASSGVGSQLSDLKKLQQHAIAVGDTKTAAQIAQKIQKLDGNQSARLSAVKAAVNAIPSPKTTVTVNSRVSVSTSISGRDVAHEVVSQSIRTHSGPGLGGDLGPL